MLKNNFKKIDKIKKMIKFKNDDFSKNDKNQKK